MLYDQAATGQRPFVVFRAFQNLNLKVSSNCIVVLDYPDILFHNESLRIIACQPDLHVRFKNFNIGGTHGKRREGF